MWVWVCDSVCTCCSQFRSLNLPFFIDFFGTVIDLGVLDILKNGIACLHELVATYESAAILGKQPHCHLGYRRTNRVREFAQFLSVLSVLRSVRSVRSYGGSVRALSSSRRGCCGAGAVAASQRWSRL